MDYYQCASCKSENTFAERDLFQKDNYDFLPVLEAIAGSSSVVRFASANDTAG